MMEIFLLMMENCSRNVQYIRKNADDIIIISPIYHKMEAKLRTFHEPLGNILPIFEGF